MRAAIAALITCLCPLAAGCGDDGSYGSSLSARTAVFESAGLEVSKFKAAAKARVEKLGAKECLAGKVSGVHVTLCSYPSDAEAKKAKDRGLASVGSTTGLSLARGTILMIAADRDKADPSGRTLNKIGKAFWGKP